MAQYFPAAFAGVALPFLFRKEGLPLEMRITRQQSCPVIAFYLQHQSEIHIDSDTYVSSWKRNFILYE